jgi:thiol:disulfide interchange protein DsbD
MITLKHALAFPMLAAAAWLIWVLDMQTASAGLPFILGCALLLAFSAWIYGLAQRRAISGRPARSLSLAAITGLVAIGGAFAMPGRAFEVQGARRLRLPAMMNARSVVARTGGAQAAAGRPVFVDFSAAWCLTCKVNEKAVLSTPAFRTR